MNEKLVSVVSHLIQTLHIEKELTSPEKTAERVASMYADVFSGVDAKISNILGSRIEFSQDSGAHLVSLSSIRFFSICEHHFLPFYGFVDISFVPDQYTIGLGRLTSLVQILARKPQLQEKYAQDVSNSLIHFLAPKGVAIHIIGKHLCESMRGNREDHQVFSTFTFTGIMITNEALQTAFMNTLTPSPD